MKRLPAQVRVLVSARAARPGVPLAVMRRVAERTLRSLRVRRGLFSVTFVGDRTMRRLNRRYLNCDEATDVLSFDLRDRAGDAASPLLGEVIVAPAVAQRQARVFGEPYRRELARYVIHGLLHWAGYDDHAPVDRRRMEARQEALVRRLVPLRKEATFV